MGIFQIDSCHTVALRCLVTSSLARSPAAEFGSGWLDADVVLLILNLAMRQLKAPVQHAASHRPQTVRPRDWRADKEQ